MSRNQTKARYVKNIVIVHGKSENIICQYIKSNLRLPLEIYSHNKGKNNIEISSLDSVLNNTVFKSRNGLDKQYLIMPKRYLRKEDLEIFIIMDKDKCSNELFDAYISKDMFKTHWMYPLITPIYNIECLEDVLSKAGYTDLRKNKRDYFKLFPINNGGFNLNEIESFHDNLLTVKDVSNLYLFVKKCLDSVETF
mgnify:CR=1 FL=1